MKKTDDSQLLERQQRFNEALRHSLKSMDTEEFLDIYFIRPIGLMEARLFNRWNIHPNTVTLISIFLGIASGFFFYGSSMASTTLAALLLFAANSLDSADGQLARMTGKHTVMGRALDGFSGDMWFFSIYICLALRMMDQPIPLLSTNWGMWSFVMAVVSGVFCHARQSMVADYYRTVHLHFIRQRSFSELSTSAEMRRQYEESSWRDLWQKLWTYVYGHYTATQEHITPQLQRLLKGVQEQYGETVPADFREAYRRKSLPLMKYCNILSFNTRAVALVVSSMLNAPWLYFLFEMTVMNGLLAYVHYRHEAFSRALYDKWLSHES